MCACRRGDLSVVARREACGGVVETHPVEDIGGLAAKLEHHSPLELNVAEEPQIDIPEPRPIEAAAAYVAVRAIGADAPSHAGPVRCVGCRIKPLGQHAVVGANPAAVRVKHGVNAGNRIGALIAGAVKAPVGPRAAAVLQAGEKVVEFINMPAFLG